MDTTETVSYQKVSLEEYNLRNCRDIDPNVFFPHDKNRDLQRIAVKAAQAICEGCIIQTLCQESAILRNEQEGVWGGIMFGSGSARSRRSYIQ